MITPAELAETTSTPLGSARHYLGHAFALLEAHYNQQHQVIVSASAIAEHAGGNIRAGRYHMITALAKQRAAAAEARILLDRFLWAAVGDPAALEHVRAYFENGLKAVPK